MGPTLRVSALLSTKFDVPEKVKFRLASPFPRTFHHLPRLRSQRNGNNHYSFTSRSYCCCILLSDTTVQAIQISYIKCCFSNLLALFSHSYPALFEERPCSHFHTGHLCSSAVSLLFHFNLSLFSIAFLNRSRTIKTVRSGWAGSWPMVTSIANVLKMTMH